MEPFQHQWLVATKMEDDQDPHEASLTVGLIPGVGISLRVGEDLIMLTSEDARILAHVVLEHVDWYDENQGQIKIH